MSDYRREKVLRVPIDDYDRAVIIENVKKVMPDATDFDLYDFLGDTLTVAFPDLFFDGENGFRLDYIYGYLDYILETETYSENDFYRARELYKSEKETWHDKFVKVLPKVDMSKVHLVEYCWYDACSPDECYEIKDDMMDFYKEIK